MLRSCLLGYMPERALLAGWYARVNALMNARLLGINDARSLLTDVAQGERENLLIHRQLRLASGFLSLKAMSLRLLQGGGADAIGYLGALAAWLDEDAFPPDAAPPRPTGAMASSSAGNHFYSTLLGCLEATGSQAAEPTTAVGHVFAGPRVYRDRHEMRLNAARTFCSLLIGVFFWLGTDWDMGYILAVLIGISCALGAHYPMVNRLVLMVLAAVALAVPTAYALLFGVFISTSELPPAMLALSPVLLVAGAGKSLSTTAFIFFHVFILGVIFLINFANPISYDFSRYANMAVAAVFSVIIVALVFYFIPQSADRSKLRRMSRAIAARFTRDMARPPLHAPFEDYVYSAIFLTRNMPRCMEKQRFIRLCCLTLAVSRVRYLAWRQSAVALPFPSFFVAALIREDYPACLAWAMRNREESDEAAWGYWWETETVLRYLLDGRVTGI
ncbi:FUSC family protein [Acerihabitans sp. KWT182]|uniref:FUSC family protein n=1 Tax=Acerihabitans sp. KWT182 TaxID=3157919 RepID=A0AAU7Q6E3_9GAMM